MATPARVERRLPGPPFGPGAVQCSMAAKKRRVGPCRLCGAQGALVLSHIVSKAAYRRAKQGPNGEAPQDALVEISREGAHLTKEQMKEYLLGRCCEDRLGVWEGYAYPMLSQRDRTFPWLAASRAVGGPLAESSAMDVDTLARFLLSIVWRLGVYKNATHRQESAHEDATRRYLLGETPFPQEAVLSVTLLDPSASTLPRVDRLFTDLGRVRGDDYTLYQVTILGVDVRLFMGRGVPREFYPLCFARTKLVAVRSSDDWARQHASSLTRGGADLA
jgi:hypothetical protein